MRKEEIENIEFKMGLIGEILEEEDFTGFIEAFRNADEVGWIFDPTLYARYLYEGGQENAAALVGMAGHLMAFRDLFFETKARHAAGRDGE